MSKYCPKCRTNFSDSFDECVYCGSSLLYGTIESYKDSQPKEKSIFEMTDEEILSKYQSYKKNIEEQTGTTLSDKEFINGLKSARRENLNKQSTIINITPEKNVKNNFVTCPYCNSSDTKKMIVSRFFRKYNFSRLVGGSQPAMISDSCSSSGFVR